MAADEDASDSDEKKRKQRAELKKHRM